MSRPARTSVIHFRRHRGSRRDRKACRRNLPNKLARNDHLHKENDHAHPTEETPPGPPLGPGPGLAGHPCPAAEPGPERGEQPWRHPGRRDHLHRRLGRHQGHRPQCAGRQPADQVAEPGRGMDRLRHRRLRQRRRPGDRGHRRQQAHGLRPGLPQHSRGRGRGDRPGPLEAALRAAPARRAQPHRRGEHGPERGRGRDHRGLRGERRGHHLPAAGAEDHQRQGHRLDHSPGPGLRRALEVRGRGQHQQRGLRRRGPHPGRGLPGGRPGGGQQPQPHLQPLREQPLHLCPRGHRPDVPGRNRRGGHRPHLRRHRGKPLPAHLPVQEQPVAHRGVGPERRQPSLLPPPQVPLHGRRERQRGR